MEINRKEPKDKETNREGKEQTGKGTERERNREGNEKTGKRTDRETNREGNERTEHSVGFQL